MEATASSLPSPRDDRVENGWTLIERPATAPDVTEEPTESRPRPASPTPEATPETPAEREEIPDGLKSPESERLADDLLREPFQAGLPVPLQLQLPVAPAIAAVEEPSTPTGASGPHLGGSCGDLDCMHLLTRDDPVTCPGEDAAAAAPSCSSFTGSAWTFERQRERMRAASRLSGEGALEGFQDPQARPQGEMDGGDADAHSGTDSAAEAEGNASDSSSALRGSVLSASLGWDVLLSGMWSDMVREWEDVRALLATSAAALWERMQEGRLAVEEWVASVRASAHQAAKSVGRSGCPLWALVGVSGLAAMTLAALASQMVTNRRLALQLRQRDRDLARLVVKILNLQDALQSAARAAAVPLMRHPSLERFATTTLIGMV
ncbi:hypothetical protein Agub_g11849 [Astrephomene gubernaculifera]|uniref:Uncharacterized protein n=1 Tax=Astrephomene gubernaculifera TaxID=47775 RepID=A0AAD3HQ43_9CHLO|nr:hypothetical protein Agub_g11849 [Astrephomene gubernaculifera]